MFGFRKAAPAAKSTPACVAVSETGLVRAANEDCVAAIEDARVFCVADGMGGGEEGAKASAIVCGEICMRLAATAPTFDARLAAIRDSLLDANDVILEYARGRGFRQMGTTAAVLVLDPDDPKRAAVVHVGDSRVYRIRGASAEALTRDHTVGFDLADQLGSGAELLRERSNPVAHVLTRAVGALEKLTVETRLVDVRDGDRFVLCSDGVHDVIGNVRLSVLAGIGKLDDSARRLAAAVEKAGAPDNYSFIIVVP